MTIIERGGRFFRQRVIEEEISEIEALREKIRKLEERVAELADPCHGDARRPPIIRYEWSTALADGTKAGIGIMQ